MFENTVLRRIFLTKNNKIAGDIRKIISKIYYFPNIIMVTKIKDDEIGEHGRIEKLYIILPGT
jgi:hypothetical protein